MSKRIAVTTFMLVFLCSIHFIISVIPNSNEIIKRSFNEELHSNNLEEQGKLTPELLSSIYGIEYIPKIEEALVIEEDIDKPVIIYLDQTAVTVKAIFRIDDTFFVVIDYMKNDELIRKKLQVGEKVLGYSLINIESRKLYFSNEDQTKNLQFNIFKRSQNNE